MLRSLPLIGAVSALALGANAQVAPGNLGQGIATYDITTYDPVTGGGGTPYPNPQSLVPSFVPGGVDIAIGAGTLAYADLHVNDAPFSLSANTVLTPGGGAGPFTSSWEFASGNVTFGFAVNGNNPGALVAMNVVALLEATGAVDPKTGFANGVGGIQAWAGLTLLDTNKPQNAAWAAPYVYNFSTGFITGHNQVNVNAPLNLLEDDIYYVEESVELQGDIIGKGTAINANAFADPTFSLAHPTPGVNLVISPGLNSLVQNGGAAPEPGAWALMIAGLGVMGSGLRRRRRYA